MRTSVVLRREMGWEAKERGRDRVGLEEGEEVRCELGA